MSVLCGRVAHQAPPFASYQYRALLFMFFLFLSLIKMVQIFQQL